MSNSDLKIGKSTKNFEVETFFGKILLQVEKTETDVIVDLESHVFKKEFIFPKKGLIIRVKEFLEWLNE